MAMALLPSMQHAAMIGGMTCQINFWLVRSGHYLRLCAAIPPVDPSDAYDANASITTYDSPGLFLSRLDTAIFEQAKVSEIKAAVIHALGTLNQVFTIPAIDLSPAQLDTLELQSHTIN
jgi:hypothetical protein